MLKTEIFDANNKPSQIEKQRMVDFLFEHLGPYGDPKPAIQRALDYSTKESISFGGFTMVLQEGDELRGIVVINRTGMSGYIPENVLVYIATHSGYRGGGLGTQLLQKAIQHTRGDIALHVEANNPAKKLYERLGFINPYLEMRLKRN